jgi:hypothetical protein
MTRLLHNVVADDGSFDSNPTCGRAGVVRVVP